MNPESNPPSSRGHVFVVHGDLLGLALDDIVVPTDRHLATTSHWHAVVPADLTPADLDEPAWPDQRWAALPGADGVWLVDTGGTADRDIGWYVDGSAASCPPLPLDDAAPPPDTGASVRSSGCPWWASDAAARRDGVAR